MNVKQIQMGSNGEGVGSKSWDFKEDGDNISDSVSIGTISEDSMDSITSSTTSLELAEEEEASSSSFSSSSSALSNGPLYELSELMTHLPIKRGLSMFYQGKAQSFTSLARVQSIEDLPKKTTPYRKRMKSCKSYGGGLDSHRISYTPKATISKKASRGSFVSVPSKRGSFVGGARLSVPITRIYEVPNK